MFRNKHLLCLFKLYKYKVKCNVLKTNYVQIRTIKFSLPHSCKEESNPSEKSVALRRNFEEIEQKTKHTYMEMVKLFTDRDLHRRGHVEFIYSALKNMESFGVHKDLEVYKSILDVLPKGRFIPSNIIQSEFMHYPKQQQCAIDLLEQMEDCGVMPDTDMEDVLLNIFGKRGHPLRKYWRMMYWMPKFKNLSPWPVPNPPPQDSFELAKLAIERITSVDLKRQITIYDTSTIPSAIDHTWIVSSQSPTQQRLLRNHPATEPIYVEGAHRVWLRNQQVNYFVLRGNNSNVDEGAELDSDDVSSIRIPDLGRLPPTKGALLTKAGLQTSVHVQGDGVYFATCATGSSSRDSLLSWIRLLEVEGGNATLSDRSVVFTLKGGTSDVAVVGGAAEEEAACRDSSGDGGRSKIEDK